MSLSLRWFVSVSKSSFLWQVVTADLRDPAALKGLLDGCDAVCASTGTTAFPSKRCLRSTSLHLLQLQCSMPAQQRWGRAYSSHAKP